MWDKILLVSLIVLIVFSSSLIILWNPKKGICEKANRKLACTVPLFITRLSFLVLLTFSVLLLLTGIFSKVAEPISFITGLAVTLSLGPLFRLLLKYATQDIRTSESKPEGFSEEKWCDLTMPLKSGGEFIGLLERILFFIALWLSSPVFIGGLLTFKVAAKWEVWKNIVQVPQATPEGFPDNLSYFIFRRKWGSELLTRFIVGTFSNILFAVIGYGFYKWVMRILDP